MVSNPGPVGLDRRSHTPVGFEQSRKPCAAELVGRRREVHTVERPLVDPVRAGGALVLAGEPGIGKSALLRRAERTARGRGFTVLTATGVEPEAQLPHAGLHQLLRPVLDRAHALVPAQRDALHAALGLVGGSWPEPFLVALAAVNLLTAVAGERPVALVVDDVHWLDPQTQAALTFIAWRAEAGGYVVISAMRSGPVNAYAASGLPRLDLHGLDDAAADRLLAGHAADLRPSDRARIRREARGNPLALIELPAVWRKAQAPSTDQPLTSLPARLERAFSGRIAEMPATTRAALLVAAVDPASELDEILAATGWFRGVATGRDVFDPAVGAGLVTVDATRVEFHHPLVRSAVLQSETVTRRRAANGAVAAVLADEPYRRTWHRAQAIVGPDDEIADELDANTTLALSRGAVMSAIRDLVRSAQLTTSSARQGHRLLLAAQYAFALGRVDVVDGLLHSASGADLTDLDRARLEWLREIFDETPGDAARVLELCNIARAATRAADRDLTRNLLLGAALRCWWAETSGVARARVVAVANEIDDAADDPMVLASLAVAEPVLQGARVADRLARAHLDDVDDGDHLRLLGMAAHAIGDEPHASDLLDRAEGSLRGQGRLGLLSHVLSMLVQVRVELGDWDRAAAAADEGQRLAIETGQPIWSIGTMVCAARATALRGNWEGALRLAAEADLDASRRGLNDLLACVQLARGTASLTAGRPADAYVALRRLFDPADPSFHHRERFAGIVPFADAAVLSGHRDEAQRVVADLEQVALATPSPILHVHLLYARAVVAEGEEACAQFRAARRADLARWPWIRSQIELAHGSLLRRQGRAVEARIPLLSAHATFERLGALTWAARAHEQLRMADEVHTERTDGASGS
jgi:AAA ATPase domain